MSSRTRHRAYRHNPRNRNNAPKEATTGLSTSPPRRLDGAVARLAENLYTILKSYVPRPSGNARNETDPEETMMARVGKQHRAKSKREMQRDSIRRYRSTLQICKRKCRTISDAEIFKISRRSYMLYLVNLSDREADC